MNYSRILKSIGILFCLMLALPLHSQQGESMYGDKVKADVKLNYVYSLEEALVQAKARKKLIFFNCFADWAIPCHGMNKHVFSDQTFADYMNQTFVNLFVDVSKRENQALAERYNIKTFAHFLVLDANGDVVHRIVGGKKLPDFKHDVMLALSTKTSLAGTQKAYNSGKRGKKELFAYLQALQLANEKDTFKQVANEYLQQIKTSDYCKKENWFIVSKLIDGVEAPLYATLIEQKNDFVKHNGEATINNFIENLFYSPIAAMASGTSPYDASQLMDLFLKMQKADLSPGSLIYKLHQIAKLRGERQYDNLLAYMRANGKALGGQKTSLDLTFEFPEMTDRQRTNVVAYLRESAKDEHESTAKHLLTLADRMDSREGIRFETGSYAQALAKAKQQGKMLFVDCYTVWCGPCKRLANEVFPRPEVGKVFNDRFVSIKIDMERGEGVELAKKFGVKAFPTMLVIDADGNEVKRMLGLLPPQKLIDEVLSLDKKDE